MQEKQAGAGQENIQNSKEARRKYASSWEVNKKVCNKTSKELGKKYSKGVGKNLWKKSEELG